MCKNEKLDWDSYFMEIAITSCRRSSDPNTQNGACIANVRNQIIGIGYNGMPRKVREGTFPWNREGDWKDTKYPYVCHAEMNAITNVTGQSIVGGKLYTTLFPCHECAKLIVQVGLSAVYYMSDKYKGQPSFEVARKILQAAGVAYIQIIPPGREEEKELSADDAGGYEGGQNDN